MEVPILFPGASRDQTIIVEDPILVLNALCCTLTVHQCLKVWIVNKLREKGKFFLLLPAPAKA